MEYGQEYYETQFGLPYRRNHPHWLLWFDHIARHIVEQFDPQTAFDAGCAMGFLVEKLRERGVHAYGCDVSEYAISQVHESVAQYCYRASITEPLSAYHDIIACIEVVEHLLPEDAETAIANLCSHTDRILFSSSPHDEENPMHINTQPVRYWQRLFAENGFLADLESSAGFVRPWSWWFKRQ